MTKQDAPIGIFDSGVGGLTVAAAVREELPAERIIYFGDTAHLPYGEKTKESIVEFSLRITDFLVQQGCKMVIIACNSASSLAYQEVVERFGQDLMILNVLDPMVQGVCAKEKVKRVGLIGTKATINSCSYQDKIKKLRPDIEVFAMSTPLLAPMVEEGYFDDEISEVVVTNYLNRPSMPHDIDTLILACTHYPLLKKTVKDYYRHKVRVLDSTDFVIAEAKLKLETAGLLNNERKEEDLFYLSEYTESFADIANRFLQDEIKLKHHPLWHLENI